MAIWLVARALGAPVPRRLVYVVDRRAVVDQATVVAEGLQLWVGNEPGVRDALGLAGALPISTLRGQFVDNKQWLADPASPAIVLGTVDMVGSRLLFSGYGVSHKMRPYHAGMLGTDTLVVLDESHLVPPFERLIEQIASGIDAHGKSLRAAPGDGAARYVPPLRLLSLSATGRRRAASEAFVLNDEDHRHPVMHQRLHAHKGLALLPEVAAKDVPDALASQAWGLTDKGRRPARVIVFVNSRDHAQKVQAVLEKLAGPSASTELFVGGRRVYEREAAADRLRSLGFIAGSDQTIHHPTFVVATAAGEVGVDLDADHAVFDVVAWERMVQRLGRVNRRGSGKAQVLVVPFARDEAKALAQQAAVMQVLQNLPCGADGTRDASPAALADLKERPDLLPAIEQASTPAPLHPPLTRAVVDAWAMTSLDSHSGRPEVGPWIRGWPDEPELPQTTVVWRSHLPVDDDHRILAGQDWDLFWDAAGPHLAEQLERDTPHVLSWILARAKAAQAAAWRPDSPADERPVSADHVVAVVVSDATAERRALRAIDLLQANKRDLERLLTGATLMVDRRLGGLSSGLLAEASDDWATDVTELGTDSAPGPVPFRVLRVAAAMMDAPSDGWRTEASIAVQRNEEGVVTWLLVRSRIEQQAGSEEGRSGARRAQLLDEHQAWAEAAARQGSLAIGLDHDHAEMLAAAAFLHDEGKRATRWQQAFHASGDGPYAKTVGRPDIALLDGYRHEFGSLPYAEAHARLKSLAPDLRELCLHMIAAHHGAARPLIRTTGAAEPPSRVAQRARDVALRYAALSKAWGPWGLAWWEALLRAADQQASRRNDEQGTAHG